jgi:hypothetical protein
MIIKKITTPPLIMKKHHDIPLNLLQSKVMMGASWYLPLVISACISWRFSCITVTKSVSRSLLLYNDIQLNWPRRITWWQWFEIRMWDLHIPRHVIRRCEPQRARLPSIRGVYTRSKNWVKWWSICCGMVPGGADWCG